MCAGSANETTASYSGQQIFQMQRSGSAAEHNKLIWRMLVRREPTYRDLVQDARVAAEQIGASQLGPNTPCTNNIGMHYSFGYAQQVHFPSNPIQPGPVYFLTTRKLGIFGVHCEGVTKQVNYLVDESVLISKGSNAVISYLDHFFRTYGLGETKAHLHCDNCSGQNKNRFVLWYMLWRCLSGLHRSIEMHFMVVGHTKVAPDAPDAGALASSSSATAEQLSPAMMMLLVQSLEVLKQESTSPSL